MFVLCASLDRRRGSRKGEERNHGGVTQPSHHGIERNKSTCDVVRSYQKKKKVSRTELKRTETKWKNAIGRGTTNWGIKMDWNKAPAIRNRLIDVTLPIWWHLNVIVHLQRNSTTTTLRRRYDAVNSRIIVPSMRMCTAQHRYKWGAMTFFLLRSHLHVDGGLSGLLPNEPLGKEDRKFPKENVFRAKKKRKEGGGNGGRGNGIIYL